MPKERKPGFKYYFSEFFNEEFAIHIETGWVYFEKGAQYSPDEIKLLTEKGAQIDMATHKVKTIIRGELVGVENERKGRGDTPKSGDSGRGESTSNGASANEKVQGAVGVSAQDGQGELDIY